MCPPTLCWHRGHPSDQRGLLLSLQLDLGNVEIAAPTVVGTRSSAAVRPSPYMASTAQTMPVCPSTGQCSPDDTPDISPAPGMFPRDPLAQGPWSFPSLFPQQPCMAQNAAPAPAVPLGQDPRACGQERSSSCAPLFLQAPSPRSPCFPLSSQPSPVPPVCL